VCESIGSRYNRSLHTSKYRLLRSTIVNSFTASMACHERDTNKMVSTGQLLAPVD
jgi:hypothetical protein